MGPSLPAVTPYRIYLTVIYIIAFGFTGFRLTHRYRTRRLWWDDFWAASALVFDIMYSSTLWMPIDVTADRHPLGHYAPAIVHWVQSQLFTFTLWSGRLSVAFSIMRILPPQSPMRRFTVVVAIIFGFIWLGLFIQRFWICGEFWGPSKPCGSLLVTGIVQLLADIIGDALLIGIPVRMLWGSRTRLPKNQRILILSIFATSLAITGTSIVHNTFILRHEVIQLVWSAHLEAAICVIVCNLLVVVTRIYCLLRHGEDLEAPTSEVSRSRPPLTTVPTDVPMVTIAFAAASRIDTFDTNTKGSSVLDDSKIKGANTMAGSEEVKHVSSKITDS